MHVLVRVKLPDHDWVIAERHKLIPSVYAGIHIKPGGIGSPDAMTYSGPTYVAIRSGNHSSSTAATHSDDFHRLMKLDCFNDILKSGDTVKPVLIFTVHGGPDENPRYPKVVGFGIQHFKMYNLDTLYIATNAPGRSAYNRVERRMAPLSRQLAGLILPHDAYGNHLNGSGKTIDVDLEQKNFAKAGETLALLWSELVVDGYEVLAEYRDPGGESALLLEVDASWYEKHARESQYLLQIAKCGEEECCGPMRSDLSLIQPDRFLPPPCRLKQDDQTGQLSISVTHNTGEEARFLPLFQRLSITVPRDKWIKMPYDACCPTVQSQLESRMCSQCELYFASKKAANSNVKSIHKNSKSRSTPKCRPKRVVASRRQELLYIIEDEDTKGEDIEWRDTDDVDFSLEDVEIPHVAPENGEAGLPIIDSVEEWITNPWTSVD
ncbi:uncharacterized protein LOC107040985 [Diachasma alloeum]|uniref:uncharacterized protein LOC107040985 n=1 Tax=Diachasma alloeum TaxID=454923 RepID=UPI00073820EC|nr:uncharacterized protein LOC107040985 [Diachasma alloeum]